MKLYLKIALAIAGAMLAGCSTAAKSSTPVPSSAGVTLIPPLVVTASPTPASQQLYAALVSRIKSDTLSLSRESQILSVDAAGHASSAVASDCDYYKLVAADWNEAISTFEANWPNMLASYGIYPASAQSGVATVLNACAGPS